MKQYFILRCKQLAKYLPGTFLAMLVLLGSLLGVFQIVVTQDTQSEENQKIQIALVGYADDPFLTMGLTALEAFDSTRFALEIQQMELEDAKTALALGQVAAYVVIPPTFIEEAMDGNILPLEFVSTTGAAGLVSLFKDEVTDVIASILLNAQKGVYGMAEALRDEGLKPGKHMDKMSIQYAEQVFIRDQVYSLEELGIADELGLAGYLLCGFMVLFLLLCCLPLGPVMIQKDLSFARMLSSRGRPAPQQMLYSYFAYALSLLVIALLLLIPGGILADLPVFSIVLQVIPVVIMTAAFSFMLYTLSSDLVGGILLQFFSTLAMCFISGCLYPVYFFPSAVQKAAMWLPAGIARSQLSGVLTGSLSFLPTLLLLGYSVLFVAIGCLVGSRRIKEVAV